MHHVPEAGQSVDPHIHVLVLNGSHRQLQSGGQVAAAGRQLNGAETNSLSRRFRVFRRISPSLNPSPSSSRLYANLFVILQNRVDVFELRMLGQKVNLVEVIVYFIPVREREKHGLSRDHSVII